MSREELIQLVEQITNPENKSEAEINSLMELLEKNVPHPDVSDLIFFENLTPEQVVDKALGYKSIRL